MRRETPYPGGLDAARAYGRQAIDDAAGEARKRYITVIPGQELTYWIKSQEVDAWEAAAVILRRPEKFPLIYASSRAFGDTPEQAKDRIKARRDFWIVKGAAIEELREGGKRAVDTAGTVQEAISVSRAIVAQLGAV